MVRTKLHRESSLFSFPFLWGRLYEGEWPYLPHSDFPKLSKHSSKHVLNIKVQFKTLFIYVLLLQHPSIHLYAGVEYPQSADTVHTTDSVFISSDENKNIKNVVRDACLQLLNAYRGGK